MALKFDGSRLANWSSQQKHTTSRIEEREFPVNGTPRFEGVPSIRYEIQPADVDPVGTENHRSETLWGSDNNYTLFEGDEIWAVTSAFMASAFPVPYTPSSPSTGHSLENQIKRSTGSPIWSSDMSGRIEKGGTGEPGVFQHHFQDYQGAQWDRPSGVAGRPPALRSGWHDYIRGYKLLTSSTTGWIEVYHRGPADTAMYRAFPRTAMQTITGSSYWKLGYYRKKSDEPSTGVIYHSNHKIFTTLLEAQDHFKAAIVGTAPVAKFTISADPRVGDLVTLDASSSTFSDGV